MLRGKIGLITGAGSGIGRSTAIKFAQEGIAALVLADLHEASATETASLLSEHSPSTQLLVVCVDVSKQDQVEAMIFKTVERFGRLDLAVNSAGIEGDRAAIADCTEENFDLVMSVNAKGIFLSMKFEIKQMLKQKRGHGEDGEEEERRRDCFSIVNLSSTAGLSSFPEFPAYCASKHAVIGLTKTAAKEYASKGIRVNAICPGTIDTPMVERFSERWPEWQERTNKSYPIGRIGQPQEIAEAITLVSSSKCEFMTGSCLTIDGGLSA